VGAGCPAKVVRSWAWVGGRPLADGRGVRASLLFGLVARSALHDPETGCALQPAGPR
jgi:hypothetical protein